MKFKNISDKAQMFKINKQWINVQSGEEFDSPIPIYDPAVELLYTLAKVVEAPLIPEAPSEDDEEEESIILYTESELKKLTKDQINDYAAIRGWDTVNTTWKKSKMIHEVLKLQNETE